MGTVLTNKCRLILFWSTKFQILGTRKSTSAPWRSLRYSTLTKVWCDLMSKKMGMPWPKLLPAMWKGLKVLLDKKLTQIIWFQEDGALTFTTRCSIEELNVLWARLHILDCTVAWSFNRWQFPMVLTQIENVLQ